MYKLTLTHGERKAIDFAGIAYRHGHELYTLLCKAEWNVNAFNDMYPTAQWDTAQDIIMCMPEHVAWEIKELIDDSSDGTMLSCFSDDLSYKLFDFINAIV